MICELRRRKGMTLIELLVSMAILVVVMAGATAAFGRLLTEQRKQRQTRDSFMLMSTFSYEINRTIRKGGVNQRGEANPGGLTFGACNVAGFCRSATISVAGDTVNYGTAGCPSATGACYFLIDRDGVPGFQCVPPFPCTPPNNSIAQTCAGTADIAIGYDPSVDFMVQKAVLTDVQFFCYGPSNIPSPGCASANRVEVVMSGLVCGAANCQITGPCGGVVQGARPVVFAASVVPPAISAIAADGSARRAF